MLFGSGAGRLQPVTSEHCGISDARGPDAVALKLGIVAPEAQGASVAPPTVATAL